MNSQPVAGTPGSESGVQEADRDDDDPRRHGEGDERRRDRHADESGDEPVEDHHASSSPCWWMRQSGKLKSRDLAGIHSPAYMSRCSWREMQSGQMIILPSGSRTVM
jgi:hypothetical protein